MKDRKATEVIHPRGYSKRRIIEQALKQNIQVCYVNNHIISSSHTHITFTAHSYHTISHSHHTTSHMMRWDDQTKYTSKRFEKTALEDTPTQIVEHIHQHKYACQIKHVISSIHIVQIRLLAPTAFDLFLPIPSPCTHLMYDGAPIPLPSCVLSRMGANVDYAGLALFRHLEALGRVM